MPLLAHRTTTILTDAFPPATLAGLLLAASPHLAALGLAKVSPTDILDATAAGRSTAYKVKGAIEGFLPNILKPAGRPPTPPPPPETEDSRIEVGQRLLGFVYQHPGCVTGSESRRRYSDEFRHFVLDLASGHIDIPLEDFAATVGVPLPTLKDWLRGEKPQVDIEPHRNLASVPSLDPTSAQIQTLLHEWANWNGTFKPFCTHVQYNLRIPFCNTLIAEALDLHGVRNIVRRDGRSPDEIALRGQFERFFPNAQWVGDGKQVDVVVDGVKFQFNLELNVDTCSAALVGADVGSTENAATVIQAFDNAVTTTGSPPIAILLDNKPSNHSDAVQEAIGDTLLIRPTPYRPETKGHVEGSFGLFAQVVPPIELHLSTPEDLARQVLDIVCTVWARTLNHRPRKDHNGKSRVQLHLDHTPTAEEYAEARAALAERLRKQELARKTLAARQDPTTRATLEAAFQELGFEDPEGHILTAIARYPLDAIVDAIAVFKGKKKAGTLPKDVDARYLLGITRNIAEEREGIAIAEILLKARLEIRDAALKTLRLERADLDEERPEEEVLIDLVDHALESKRAIDHFFWLHAAVDLLTSVSDGPQQRHLLHLAARRIHSTHKVPHDERLRAVRFLFGKTIPVA
jgi:hypothetical protein